MKWYGLVSLQTISRQISESLSSTNFTRSILEYFVPNILVSLQTISLQISESLSSTNFTRSILEYFVPNIPLFRASYYVLIESAFIKGILAAMNWEWKNRKANIQNTSLKINWKGFSYRRCNPFLLYTSPRFEKEERITRSRS